MATSDGAPKMPDPIVAPIVMSTRSTTPSLRRSEDTIGKLPDDIGELLHATQRHRVVDIGNDPQTRLRYAAQEAPLVGSENDIVFAVDEEHGLAVASDARAESNVVREARGARDHAAIEGDLGDERRPRLGEQ